MALNSKVFDFMSNKQKEKHCTENEKKLAESSGLVFKRVPRLLLKNLKV